MRWYDIPEGVITVGHDIVLLIPIEDSQGLPKDMSGIDVEFMVREAAADAAPLITKSTPEITLATTARGAAQGVSNDGILVPISADDTYDANSNTILLNGKYTWAVAATSAPITLLEAGSVVIKAVAHR